MKHLYACLALAGLSFGARAQTGYQPLFRIGYTYQYTEAGTPGDTTHTVRMAFPHISSPDSVARLSGRAVALTRTAGNCPTANVLRPDGLFGATVSIKTLGGKEYTVRGYNGRTFLLKPLAALNQPWTVTAAGLTAQVTARAATTTFGQPDQVATITLSDGETIRYSEKWGYLEGPNLGAYLNGQPRRHLTLTAITGQGVTLGQPAVGARAAFDYQPGDVFLRYSRQLTTQGGATCSENWTRDSVLTRTLSPDGDTLRYTIWRRSLVRTYGAPNAPSGFCQNTPGTTLAPGYTTTLAVPRTDETLLSALTHNLTSGPSASFRGLTLAGYRTSSYNGRKQQLVLMQQVCQPVPAADSVLLSNIVDNGGGSRYAAGLGQVEAWQGGIYYTQSTTLLGYRKVNQPTSTGTETWGALRTFANILKAADYRPAASTAVFPNPFAQELTLRFEAQRAQAVTVQLRNALGQLVHAETRAVKAGTQQLPLALPALAAGLYTVQLTADGRTQVLRVAKEQ